MSAIFAQRLTGPLTSLDVKESAYKGLVCPVLAYGSSVWDPNVYFLKINLRRFRKEQLDL